EPLLAAVRGASLVVGLSSLVLRRWPKPKFLAERHRCKDRRSTTDAFPFSHLSRISAKNQRIQALMFVPAWSIKVTPKSCDGLSRSVKQEPRLDRCAA